MKYYRAPHSKKDVVGKREREREKKRGREKRRKNFSLIIFCVALNFTEHHQHQGKKREISSSIRFWWSRLNKSE